MLGTPSDGGRQPDTLRVAASRAANALDHWTWRTAPAARMRPTTGDQGGW